MGQFSSELRFCFVLSETRVRREGRKGKGGREETGFGLRFLSVEWEERKCRKRRRKRLVKIEVNRNEVKSDREKLKKIKKVVDQ